MADATTDARSADHAQVQTIMADHSLISLFEQMVGRFADRIALRDEHRALTYDQLNRRINRAAHAILNTPEHSAGSIGVALLFDHEVDAVSSVFAVLKAGKAYIPLASWQPFQRSLDILNTTRPCALLTNDPNLSVAESLVARMDQPVPLINIDHLPDTLPESNPGLPIDPESTFAILHTSGSTGVPKAIARTHRIVLDKVPVWVKRTRPDVHEHDLFYMSYTTGASRSAIVSPLVMGRTLHMYDMRNWGTSRLTSFCRERQITSLSLMATVLRRWLDTMTGPVNLPDLRQIRLGGEPVIRSDIEGIIALLPPQCSIEISLAAGEVGSFCRYTIDRDNLFEGDTVPVGFPMPGRKVKLLDDEGREVPPGEVGEFVVTVPNLSPAYIFDEELSRRKFQPDPDEPAKLRYFTGDLGRLRPDGMYEFVGRKDSMVKVRGSQVVTNDLEDILRTHPALREVAVKPIGLGSEDVRIAAYYVLADPRNEEVTITTLRDWLAERVPDYMIPSYFIALDQLPLTETGKVNRPVLPEPDHVRPDLAEVYVPPSTTLEIQLVRIWEDLLGVSPIGIDDGFFDLGGHSLLASQVIYEIEHQLGMKILLAALSQAPTVRRVAEVLQHYDSQTPLSLLVPIQPKGTSTPLFCMHPRGGLVGLYYHLARNLGIDQPVYGLQAQGLDGITEPHHTIPEMASAYITEIKAIQPEGPYYLCGFSLGGQIAHEVACQLAEQGDSVGLLALLDAQPPRAFWARGLSRIGQSLSAITATAANMQRAMTHTLRIMSSQPVNRWLPEIRLRRERIAATWDQQAADRAAVSDPFNQPQWTPERRVLWANRKAGSAHQPRRYPGPVVYFRAADVPLGQQSPKAYLSTLAAGGVTVIEIPGDHRAMMEEPHVKTLADRLSSLLA